MAVLAPALPPLGPSLPAAPPPCAAVEEAAGASCVDDPLSLTEAAARLKQLELESGALHQATPKNVNLNMAMNNQDSVVKLTEKVVLSCGSSPLPTPLRTPDHLKSNILKAQAEAASTKASPEELPLLSADKNCNLQDATARLKVHSGRLGSNSSLSVRAEVQELLKPPSGSSSAAVSVERLTELTVPLDFTTETLTPKVCPEAEATLCENLIDFSDTAPVLPPVQPPKPVITPRWIIPATAPPGIFSNGVLDPETKISSGPEGHVPLSRSNINNNSSTAQQPPHPPEEDASKSAGLLTTEL